MPATRTVQFIAIAAIVKCTLAADLAIQLPRQGSSSVSGGSYRLDYSPPYGQPPANTTISSQDIGDVIHFSQALPGTRYEFWLYYSNSTVDNNWLLTWTASITTAPDPPTNLTVQVKGGKVAHVSWSPPASGNYDSFKLKVNGLSSSLPASEQNVGRVIVVPSVNPSDSDKGDSQQQAVQQYVLKELTPGATYQVQLFGVYDRKESVAYISRNFTTKPSTPGKFIVWFRNETTLLVLWQPSYPASVFTHYKVSVEPPDSPESVLYVEREGEPPGPAQAAFKGLVPGRAYNISVHTVSEDETSQPTTAQYRTIPLRPTNLIVDHRLTGSYNVRVRWDPPKGLCEFDKYQISVNAVAAAKKSTAVVPTQQQQSTPITIARSLTSTDLNHDMEPGRTYQVLVKTVSGKVASWPASVNVTLKPLPVIDLKIARVEDSVLTLQWAPDSASYQDAYQVAYTEVVSNTGANIGQLPGATETAATVVAAGLVVPGGGGLIQQQQQQQQTSVSQSSQQQQSSAGAADSNVIIVPAANQVIADGGGNSNNLVECTLDALLPGRNYSIAVRALSGSGAGLAASNDTIVYHTMKPSAPIIEDLRPTIDYGLNVSWKTDVNSRQETFQVVCRRNDTDDIPMVRITSEWRVSLRHLYPGAAYQIKVFAISHGLLSEPHDYFQAVYPRPPVDLQVENITAAGGAGSVLIKWNRPVEDGGLFTEYSIKYRTVDSSQWIRLPGVPPGVQEAEIADMTAGQRYTIQVNTQTYGALESPSPQQVNYTIRPNPITNVALLVDAANVTLTFPRPEGLLEYYTVQWWILADHSTPGPTSSSTESGSGSVSITTAGSTGGSKNISDSAATATNVAAVNGQSSPTLTISLSVDDLVPGARYTLRVRTTSHGLHSDYTQLTANTMPLILSEVLAVNDQHTTDTLTLRYTPTPQVASRFEKYRFQLASGSNSLTADDGKPTQSLIAEKLATDNEWKVTWQGLTPGRLYDITVWTVSAEGVLSQPLRRQDRLYPEPISELNATHIGRDAVTLAWRVPRGQYDAFQIQYLLEGDSDSPSATASATLAQNLTVDPWFDVRGLRPYRNYTFTVVVRAGGSPPSSAAAQASSPSPPSAPNGGGLSASNAVLRRSVPLSATFATLESVPGVPQRLAATDIRPQQLTLEWSLPEADHNGVLLRYVVSWKELPGSGPASVHDDDGDDDDDDDDGGRSAVILRGPDGGHLAAGPAESDASPAEEKTIYLESWRNRATIGGGGSGSGGTTGAGGSLGRGGGAASAGLIPGRVYLFTVCGETRAGRGRVAHLRQRMPILAPPKPSAQAVPTEVSRTRQSIQVRFRKNYFSEANGAVLGYTVIVAEDDGKNASGLEMPSWRDVQAYSTWPPYQVLEPYTPFSHNKTVEDFTIGQDHNCNNNNGGNYNSVVSKSSLSLSSYCNGPLKPATVYRVKIRAFTAPDKFTDTSYSFPIQTDQDTASSTGTTAAIALIVVFILLMLCAAAAYSKYKKNVTKNAGGAKRNVNGIGGGQQRRTAGSKFFSDSAFPPQRNTLLGGPGELGAIQQGSCDLQVSRPVRADRFIEHYAQMSADSDFRFSEEFEELKHVGRQQPCAAADLPCNRPKNRFTNILPYDHSRFKLQPVDDEEGSDYINANYVPGHNSVREFIVTQGPLHSTRDDFWRMCWESGTRSIVMLTRCVEKGREKCDHYWPYDTQPTYYGGSDGGDGGICVTLLNDSHYADYVITEFMVCRNDQKRVIRHFHFTTWPDFGVPSPPQTLCRFVRAFRDRISTPTGMNAAEQSSQHRWPIIVHCSAGVGRSGTFIALDRVLQSIQEPHHPPGTFLPPHTLATKYIDVYGIVCAMRKERVWMVQTEQQYICIHQCIVSVLQSLFSPDQQLKEQYQYGGQYHLGHDGVDDEDLMSGGGSLMICSTTGVAHHNRAFEDDEGIAESGM